MYVHLLAIAEVKLSRAWLVLGWKAAWEPPHAVGMVFSLSYFLPVHFYGIRLTIIFLVLFNSNEYKLNRLNFSVVYLFTHDQRRQANSVVNQLHEANSERFACMWRP